MAGDRLIRTALVVIATVAVLVALYFARFVFTPVAFALFIMAIAWPLQSRLQSRMPPLLALTVIVVVIVLVCIAFGALIAWSFARIGRWMLNNSAQFQALYENAAVWLDSYGIGVASLWAEHFDVRWLVRLFQGVTVRANAIMTFWLIVLVYVALGLLEVEDAGRKVRALKNREVGHAVYDGCVAVASRFRKYMLVRTLMSIITGVLVWAVAAAFGLPLAVEWGVVAFTLNYIPFIGPFIATVFPTLFALAQFASWQLALVVFVCLNAIQFVGGSYIEPRVSGTMLAMSPFVVLFAVFFWTFMWGLPGAFIGVPITIAVLTFCAQHPSSQWVSDLFGAPGGNPKPVGPA